jgi:hypothetical protein
VSVLRGSHPAVVIVSSKSAKSTVVLADPEAVMLGLRLGDWVVQSHRFDTVKSISFSIMRGARDPVTLRADIVRRVMAGEQPSKPPQQPGANDGWTAVGYLLSGILAWTGLGWLADRWLETGGIAIAVCAIIGAVGGIYLVMRRFSP